MEITREGKNNPKRFFGFSCWAKFMRTGPGTVFCEEINTNVNLRVGLEEGRLEKDLSGVNRHIILLVCLHLAKQLRGPAAVLFISRNTCSNSIAKLFRAYFYGGIAPLSRDMLQNRVSHRCACVKLSTKGGIAPFWGSANLL